MPLYSACCNDIGDRLLAHRDGRAGPVGLASAHERPLDVALLETLRARAVDVRDDLGTLYAPSALCPDLVVGTIDALSS